MKFVDSQVFTNLCIGENSVEEMAHFARELGYSAIVANHVFQGMGKFLDFLKAIAEINVEGIEVIPGITIEAKDVKELKDSISKTRSKVLMLIVKGGNYVINRAACEDSRVDILMDPHFNRIDNGLDDVCLNFAKRNGVAIGISFRPILKSYRRQRVLLLQNIAINLKLCKEMDVKVVVCSGAQSKWELRDPRQLIAISDSFGFDFGKGFSSLSSVPMSIIEKNHKIISGKSVKGAEVVDHG